MILNIEGKIDENTKAKLKKVFETAISSQPDNFSINLYFINPIKIKKLNNKFRNINKPTDVLSFPFLPLKKDEVIDLDKYPEDIDRTNNHLCLGEIFICDKIAKKQAREYGHTILRERCFLFVHGILHLLGYDHIEDDDRFAMEDAQRQILNKCEITRGEE